MLKNVKLQIMCVTESLHWKKENLFNNLPNEMQDETGSAMQF